MFSTFHNLPKAAVFFSQLTHMTSVTNIPSATNNKNVFWNPFGCKHCELKIRKLPENILKIK